MCIHIYVCIHYVYMNIYKYMQIYIYTYIHIYVCIYLYICIHIYIYEVQTTFHSQLCSPTSFPLSGEEAQQRRQQSIWCRCRRASRTGRSVQFLRFSSMAMKTKEWRSARNKEVEWLNGIWDLYNQSDLVRFYGMIWDFDQWP